MVSVIREYYQLIKPGIVYGNAMTAAAGFFLASGGAVDWGRLLAMLVGLALVIGAACVFNNYLDRGIDEKMARTQHRALARGVISGRAALGFGVVLAVAGFMVLVFYTNVLTVALGLLGCFFYVVVYGIWKRRSVYGTLVGSISGAIPPVAGYAAAANQIDLGAVLLFLVLVFWQMPHFYAIAMYRRDDYAAAGVPVWSVKRGMHSTKVQILWYTGAFVVASMSLTLLGYTGYAYLSVMMLIGVVWLMMGIQGLGAADDKLWARKMFLFSLVVLLVLSLMLMIDSVLY